jgi:hypothetical protein
MNVANLQLQGLIMAVAAINNALVHRGVLSVDDVDLALQKAEQALTGEERFYEDLPQANRDAVCFPIRLLQAANHSQGETDVESFGELARLVGQTKEQFGDQK